MQSRCLRRVVGVGLEQDRSWGGAGPAAPPPLSPPRHSGCKGRCVLGSGQAPPSAQPPAQRKRGGLGGQQRATPPSLLCHQLAASLPQPTSQTPGLQGSAAALHPHSCCRVQVCGGTWAPLAAQGAEPGLPEVLAPCPLASCLKQHQAWLWRATLRWPTWELPGLGGAAPNRAWCRSQGLLSEGRPGAGPRASWVRGGLRTRHPGALLMK